MSERNKEIMVKYLVIWVKGIREFVLSFQLFCKSEVIS